MYENHICELQGEELYESTRSYRRNFYSCEKKAWITSQRPAPSWLGSPIVKSAAPVSRSSRVRIPYKPEFF